MNNMNEILAIKKEGVVFLLLARFFSVVFRRTLAELHMNEEDPASWTDSRQMKESVKVVGLVILRWRYYTTQDLSWVDGNILFVRRG